MYAATMPQEMTQAWQVLFGAPATDLPTRLNQLSPSDLKAVYKKRAMETHPDRAQSQGRSSAAMAEAFKAVNWAYQYLKEIVAEPGRRRPQVDPPPPPASTARRPAPQAAPRAAPRPQEAAEPRPQTDPEYWRRRRQGPADHYWAGALPHKKLPIGQYLYYSGAISWNALISALSWQRQQRPRFGEVALKMRLFSANSLHDLLCRRSASERIGDAALRLKLLNPLLREAVLFTQEQMTPRLGEFFVTHGVFSGTELEAWLARQSNHNSGRY